MEDDQEEILDDEDEEGTDDGQDDSEEESDDGDDEEEPEKKSSERNQSLNNRPWLFQPGNQASKGKGRPKGTVSLKDFARKYLKEMNDEEKLEFMRGISKDTVWKMSDGNPDSKTTMDVKVEASPEAIKKANDALANFIKKDDDPGNT